MRYVPSFARLTWTAAVTTIKAAFNEPGRDLRVAYCRLLHNAALGLVGGAVALYVHRSLTAPLATAAAAVGALVLFFAGASLLSGGQK